MSKLTEMERAIGQAETAIATLHSTVGALVEAEAALTRARRGLMRPRNVVIAGALTVGLIAVLVAARKARARRIRAEQPEGSADEAGFRVAS